MNALRRILVRLGIGSSDDDSHSSPVPSSRRPTPGRRRLARYGPGDWGAEGGGLPPNYVKSYDEGRPRK